MLQNAENTIHEETAEHCSLSTTTEATEKKMRKYRNYATAVTVIIEIVLFATGASFWWQALAIFPTLMAASSMLQEKSKM